MEWIERQAARWRWGMAAAGLLVLAACGGGGGGTDPAAEDQADVIELQAGVQTVAAGDPRGLAEPAEGLLTQAAGTPLEPGAVIVLADKAIKITARRDDGTGGFAYDTTTPRLAEVFERIRISAPVAGGRERPAGARERAARSFAIDRYELKPNLGAAKDYLDLNGAIEAATATVEFDWDRRRGLQRAELTMRGRLALTGALQLKAERTLKRFTVPVANPVSIRIPQSLFLASIEVPVSIAVEVKSELSTRLATLSQVYDFEVGTRWDPVSATWTNVSRFDEVGSNLDPVPLDSIEGALAALLPALAAQNQPAWTVATLKVGPSIKPGLALLKSVGAVGVRADVGMQAGLTLAGQYPRLLSCLKVGLSRLAEVYGYYDFAVGPFWAESFPLRLFISGGAADEDAADQELARSEFKLFTLKQDIAHPLKWGECGGARPYDTTYRTLEATVGTPVCVATDPQGRCIGTMWCNPGDQVGEVLTGVEQWKLDGTALLAELETSWMDAPLTHRGVYQPGARTISLPTVSVTQDVTPAGASERYFSTGTLAFDGRHDPLTGEISGTVSTTVTTSWSRDARSVSCSAKYAYSALPKQ